MHKILVVDDEERIADILEKYLSRSGFEVIKIIGGEKALEVLNSDTKIDLMLLDMKMPKIDGMDIIRKARELGKEFPIVLLTGSIDVQTYLDELKGIGVSEEDVLYKPVELPTLLEKVKEKLGIA